MANCLHHLQYMLKQGESRLGKAAHACIRKALDTCVALLPDADKLTLRACGCLTYQVATEETQQGVQAERKKRAREHQVWGSTGSSCICIHL